MSDAQADLDLLTARVREAAESGTLRQLEQAVIELRLALLGSVPKAAESLGTSLPTLYKKVRHYKLAANRQNAEARRKD